MKSYQLSPSEKHKLELLHRQTQDGRVKDRLKAILLYDKGRSLSELSEILYKSERTIRRHIEDYHRNKKIRPDNGGSHSKLDEEKTDALKSYLSEQACVQSRTIAAYIKAQWQIPYTLSGITKWLHSNGISYKKPQGIPYKADEAQQNAFRKHYEVLKADADKEDVILFMDAVHPTQATRLSRSWIRKGYNKPVLTTGSRTQVNIIGCIQLGHLSETLVKDYDKVNAEAIQDFLQRILDQYKDKKTIHLILDGAGYHKAAEVIKKANELKIKFHFLPPYSPNLNPIERLWKVMNEAIRNNIIFPDAKNFRKSINDFFYKILPAIGNTLDVRINGCFQRI